MIALLILINSFLSVSNSENHIILNIETQKDELITLGETQYKLSKGENIVQYYFSEKDDLLNMEIKFALLYASNKVTIDKFDIYYNDKMLPISMDILSKIIHENYLIKKSLINNKLELKLNKYWNSLGILKFIVNPLSANSTTLIHNKIIFFGESNANNFVSIFSSDTLMKYKVQKLWEKGTNLVFDFYTLSDNQSYKIFLGDRKFKFRMDSAIFQIAKKKVHIPSSMLYEKLTFNHYLSFYCYDKEYYIESLSLNGRQEPYISYSSQNVDRTLRIKHKYVLEIKGNVLNKNGLISFSLLGTNVFLKKIVTPDDSINISHVFLSATRAEGFDIRISEPISDWDFDQIKISSEGEDFIISKDIKDHFILSNTNDLIFHYNSSIFLKNKWIIGAWILLISFLLVFTNKLYFEYYK